MGNDTKGSVMSLKTILEALVHHSNAPEDVKQVVRDEIAELPEAVASAVEHQPEPTAPEPPVKATQDDSEGVKFEPPAPAGPPTA